ncbi:hypothetical protein DFJ43DRAFT_8540 [Lentinula guzmanii]|uniref:Secreted protein n=1 Tax=Lentinula guzmanii TaxID=2804957 RepID=A0AA38JLC9_9AGAR|nr:hypothetical protein DFJ43DRAFT_8540 [Lentinula guzmanii]
MCWHHPSCILALSLVAVRCLFDFTSNSFTYINAYHPDTRLEFCLLRTSYSDMIQPMFIFTSRMISLLSAYNPTTLIFSAPFRWTYSPTLMPTYGGSTFVYLQSTWLRCIWHMPFLNLCAMQWRGLPPGLSFNLTPERNGQPSGIVTVTTGYSALANDISQEFG